VPGGQILHSHLTKMEIKFPFRSTRSLLQVQRVAVNPSPCANEISPSCYENIRQKRCAYPMRTRFHRHGETRCSKRSRTLTEGHRGILYHPAWISGGSQWRFSVMDCRRHDSAFRGGRRSNKARPLLIVSALEAVIQRSISLQRGFRAFGKSN